MLAKLVKAEVRKNYRVWLAFADGLAGEIDLEPELYGEIFDPLKEPGFFAQMRLDPELGTIAWPNGADFAPEFLYGKLNPEQGSPESDRRAAP